MTDSPFPPERLQHDRVTRDSVQIADANGAIGRPWKTEGLLGRLERHGDIGPGERLAGERFQEIFTAAGMDPLRCSGMAHRSHGKPVDAPSGVLAREQVHACLTALGGHGSAAGTASWMILGLGMSLREWSMREGWQGRPISPHVAKGVIIAALGILRAHFRF